jgi:alcohol dehydrogenase
MQNIYQDLGVASEAVLSGDSKRVFFVTGKKSFELSGAKNRLDNLINRKGVGRFYDFENNPKLEDVEKGVELYLKAKPDYVVGVGGGSVIDMAKMIIGLSGVEDVKRALINNERFGEEVPLLAVPTTSGSGSESTPYAVVYVDRKKYSFNHQKSIPQEIVLDPSLTYSMDRRQTAVTGFDVLSQGIESFWSINSNEESKGHSRDAIKLCLENLERSANNFEEKARGAMMLAANFAGRAIAIAKTTAPHALSYSMSSLYGVPHGLAVALTLGEIYEHNSKVDKESCNDLRGADYVRETMLELNEILGARDGKEAKEKINRLMVGVGLETCLYGVGVKDIELITNEVNEQRLKNNPRKLGKQDLRGILERVF